MIFLKKNHVIPELKLSFKALGSSHRINRQLLHSLGRRDLNFWWQLTSSVWTRVTEIQLYQVGFSTFNLNIFSLDKIKRQTIFCLVNIFLPKWDQTNSMSTPVQLLDKNILKKSSLVSAFLSPSWFYSDLLLRLSNVSWWFSFFAVLTTLT